MKTVFCSARLLARFVTAAIFASLTPAAFSSLVITPTFTANFNANFGANSAAAQASWISAANQFSANFNDNININITVDAAAGTSIFGQSSTFLNSLSYATLRSRLIADSITADDTTSLLGSISAADPVGAAHTWWVTRAQAKAIGLIANDGANDGTTTFGAGNPFTFSGPIASGTYDFQGIALHEMTEVMGRLGLSGGTIGASANSYSLIDALSFTGPGARGMTAGAGEFFSIDAGVTLLKLYNNAALNSLDTRDWAAVSQGGTGAADAFNQFSNPNIVNGLTAADLRLMDVIGFNLAPVPEPATSAMLISGVALVLGFRRSQR